MPNTNNSIIPPYAEDAVKELYEKEKIFRDNMQKFAEKMNNHLSKLPPEYQTMMKAYLQPYVDLVDLAKPALPVRQSGDTHQEILEKLTVAFSQNGALLRQFDAFSEAVNNKNAFELFMKLVNSDPRCAQWAADVKKDFKIQFISELNNFIIEPIQRVPRYGLFAAEYLKQLNNSDMANDPNIKKLIDQASQIQEKIGHFAHSLNENERKNANKLRVNVENMIVKLTDIREKADPSFAGLKSFCKMLETELAGIRDKDHSSKVSHAGAINDALTEIQKIDFAGAKEVRKQATGKPEILKQVAKALLKLHPSHHAKNGLFRGMSKLDKAIYDLEKKIAAHPFCESKKSYNEARSEAKHELREAEMESKKTTEKAKEMTQETTPKMKGPGATEA
jgi:hypothetical protein